MKRFFFLFTAGAAIFSLNSCEDLENALAISLEPTFEETFTISLPDSSRPGESQSMYMSFIRNLEFHGEDAPEELRNNAENLVDVSFDNMYIEIDGVEGEIVKPQTLSGYIVFFPGDHFDPTSFPGDHFDPTSFPGDHFDPTTEVGSAFEGAELFRQQIELVSTSSDEWLRDRDGEGVFELVVDEKLIDVVNESMLNQGGIAYGIFIEFNGEMPFKADLTYGLQFKAETFLHKAGGEE